jgi:glycosyltransferase involved in cell wall biosynthesis
MKDVPDRPFLLIAGRGGSKGQLPVEHYQQRVEEWGLMDDVQFMHRFIADDEVGPLFHLSDLVMLTYRTGFTSQSGVLNVAMHYGKPVLSTPAPTMAETIHNYQVGVVCKDDSADAIAVGYSEWLQSRDRFSQSSFDRYTTEHSWHRNATLTNEVYRSLLLQRSVPEQQYSSFSPVKNADE